MRAVFADTGYWVAVIHPLDGLHERAMAVSAQLEERSFVTSEMVLAEVLNTFSGHGQHLREAAARTVHEIAADPNVEVFPQIRQLFREALALYETRADKIWSLPDCSSFVIMKKHHVDEALTDDHHYIQNGFKALLEDLTVCNRRYRRRRVSSSASLLEGSTMAPLRRKCLRSRRLRQRGSTERTGPGEIPPRTSRPAAPRAGSATHPGHRDGLWSRRTCRNADHPHDPFAPR